jgi:hypothetical protein
MFNWIFARFEKLGNKLNLFKIQVRKIMKLYNTDGNMTLDREEF